MSPRSPSSEEPAAFTHACVARRLLRRAVSHLQHAEDESAGPPDESNLIEQALERLAVADLLLDAYTQPGRRTR